MRRTTVAKVHGDDDAVKAFIFFVSAALIVASLL